MTSIRVQSAAFREWHALKSVSSASDMRSSAECGLQRVTCARVRGSEGDMRSSAQGSENDIRSSTDCRAKRMICA